MIAKRLAVSSFTRPYSGDSETPPQIEKQLFMLGALHGMQWLTSFVNKIKPQGLIEVRDSFSRVTVKVEMIAGRQSQALDCDLDNG